MRVLSFVCFSFSLLFVLTGCGTGDVMPQVPHNQATFDSNSSTQVPTFSSAEPSSLDSSGHGDNLHKTDVDWEFFDSELKSRIDQATASGDCKLLQELLDAAKSEDINLNLYFKEAKEIANCD